MRRRPKTDETFKVSSATERLEKEAFLRIIKSDVLDARRKEIHADLSVITQVLSGPYSSLEKGIAVDEVFALMMSTASPWLRSMDNPFLANKINLFLRLYDEFRYIPEFLGMLTVCAASIINLSMCNIDVEPISPIVITPSVTKETQVVHEPPEKHEEKKKGEKV